MIKNIAKCEQKILINLFPNNITRVMETYSFAGTVYMDVPDRRFFLCKNHEVQGATLPKKNGHDHKVNL